MKSNLRISKLDLSKFKTFAKNNKVKILKITKRENPKFMRVETEHSSKVHVGFWKKNCIKRSTKKCSKKRSVKRKSRLTKKRSKRRSKKRSVKRKSRSTKKRSKRHSKKRSVKRKSRSKKLSKRSSVKRRSPKKSIVRKRHYSTSPSREKRRSERPSPSTGASSQKIGTVMRGNDGNMYKVIKTTAGIRHWVKK